MRTEAARKLILEDPRYKKIIANKADLIKNDPGNLLLQYSIITLLDAEMQTVIHTTCRNQDHELLKFFIEKAGPGYLNVLDKIIDVPDELDVTPIYMLCESGFDNKKNKTYSPLNRKNMLKLLVEGDADVSRQ